MDMFHGQGQFKSSDSTPAKPGAGKPKRPSIVEEGEEGSRTITESYSGEWVAGKREGLNQFIN